MTITLSRIVLLLVAVAVVASLATALTIGGVVVYAATRPTPTAQRAPVYIAPRPQSQPLTNPGQGLLDWQKEQDRKGCDVQWRQYQQDYADYAAKTAQGNRFASSPMKPWC